MTMLQAVTRALVPEYRPKRPRKRVAIVVPLSTRDALTPDEEISMRHLVRFLGHYDKYLIAPEGSAFRRDGFHTVHFARKFFGSAAAINHLNYWPRFYERFEDYEYILIYHLDALVFSDQLLQWCASGVDYIGAPWIPCPDTPWVKEARVGNGGFTLMNVQRVLEVLHRRYRQDPASYWSELFTRHQDRFAPLLRGLERLEPLAGRSGPLAAALRHWRVSREPERHGRNNDYLWSFRATTYLPDFKVATVEQGLRFAFEAAPRRCFEMSGGHLPFGCHAWTRFDRGFWEPHLLTTG